MGKSKIVSAEPLACVLLCVIGRHCVVTPNGPRCIPNSCPANEVLNDCGKQCEGKCQSFCERQECPDICTGQPECACEKGFYRNNVTGECVSKEDCPSCPTTTVGYPTEQTTAPPIHFCNILCKCGFHCIVTPTGPACVPNDFKCPENEHYNKCGNHCENTCQYANAGPRPCIYICGPPACICDDDYYRNSHGECVPKNECGCGQQAPVETTTQVPNPCDSMECDESSICKVINGYGKCIIPASGPDPCAGRICRDTLHCAVVDGFAQCVNPTTMMPE